MPSTLQDAGRIALAEAFKAQPLHVAWGTGSAAWDTTPEPEPTTATTLLAEVGRRTVTTVDDVLPDAGGDIHMPTGERYAVSAAPTPTLYVRTVFDFADADGHTIRELALMVGTQTIAGLPAGLRYFTPAQIDQPGRMYLLNRDERIVRSGSTYQSVEFIVPF